MAKLASVYYAQAVITHLYSNFGYSQPIDVFYTGSYAVGMDTDISDVDLWIAVDPKHHRDIRRELVRLDLAKINGYDLVEWPSEQDAVGHAEVYGNRYVHVILVPKRYANVKLETDKRVKENAELFYLFPKEARRVAYAELWKKVVSDLAAKEISLDEVNEVNIDAE